MCELQASLSHLFIPPDAQQALWALLYALLAVSELQFASEDDEHGAARVCSEQAIAEAEAAMGCPGLGALLTSQPMKSPRGGSTYTISVDARRAAATRDTVCAELYRCVFDALVARINAVLSGTRTAATSAGQGGGGSSGSTSSAASQQSSVGLLDLFGFENFETNSFEQLCINYANEALQHFFLQATFHAEELLHAEEGVAWSPVRYPDNASALDLLARSPSGIFYILDATCRTPQATDTTFANQLFQVHRDHPLLAPPPTRSTPPTPGAPGLLLPAAGGSTRRREAAHQHGENAQSPPPNKRRPLRRDEGFTLHHFAGSVTYTVSGFSRKSTERVPAELEALIFDTPTSVARAVLVEHLPLPSLTAEMDASAIVAASPMKLHASPLKGGGGGRSQLARRQQQATTATRPLQRMGGGSTVGRQFVGVVRALMQQLAETSAFFVRCLAPNATGTSAVFDPVHVLRQLRQSGTAAMLRMAHTAHLTSIPYNELYFKYRALAPLELAALQPADFVEGLLLALGVPEQSFQLGHTMAFFRHGAAAKLHDLDALTRGELRERLHAAVADFAAHAAARRAIQRGVTHWVRWRRLKAARHRRAREQAARAVMMRAVGDLRRRRLLLAAAAATRQARADERAKALRSANTALGRLKRDWLHAGRLEAAIKAAEGAFAHKALPAEWAACHESGAQLEGARKQLQELADAAKAPSVPPLTLKANGAARGAPMRTPLQPAQQQPKDDDHGSVQGKALEHAGSAQQQQRAEQRHDHHQETRGEDQQDQQLQQPQPPRPPQPPQPPQQQPEEQKQVPPPPQQQPHNPNPTHEAPEVLQLPSGGSEVSVAATTDTHTLNDSPRQVMGQAMRMTPKSSIDDADRRLEGRIRPGCLGCFWFANHRRRKRVAGGEVADTSGSTGAVDRIQTVSTEAVVTEPNVKRRESATTADSSWSLSAVLEHPEGVTALRAFCRREQSEENVALLEDARAWREAWGRRTELERRRASDELARTYLLKDAPMEVCLPRGPPDTSVLQIGMFDDAVRHARNTLLLDIFPRFEESEAAVALRGVIIRDRVAVATASAAEPSKQDARVAQPPTAALAPAPTPAPKLAPIPTPTPNVVAAANEPAAASPMLHPSSDDDVDFSWGMFTPVASARDSPGPGNLEDYSDDDGDDGFAIMVFTPPPGSPVDTERSDEVEELRHDAEEEARRARIVQRL